MLLVNISDIPGKKFEVIGIVKGSIVQSKHVGKDILAGLKTILGGEIIQYTEMLVEAREIATNRMKDEAKKLGADAILKVTYSTAGIMQGSAEIIAYGTAIKFV